MATRLPLVWSPWLRPVGLLIGGMPSRNWVEVDDDGLRASFGALAWAEVPRPAWRSAKVIPWSRWRGLGVRWYGREAVGFVGRTKGVVEIVLAYPVEVRAVLPRKVTRLALSPDDPGRLLALLGLPVSG